MSRNVGLALATFILTLLVGVPVTGLLVEAFIPQPDVWGGPPPTFGEILASAGLGRLLLNSVSLATLTALLALPWGTWLAWAEARYTYPLRTPLGLLALLPLSMPSYLLAATFSRTLSPGGTLGPLGLDATGLLPSALVLALVTVPYVHLVVRAALARQSAAEEEAALLLGASPLQRFQLVSWPTIRPALGYGGLLVMLYALSDFGAVAVLDCPVLTWRLYQAAAGQDLAKAAVLGAGVLLATLPLFFLARVLQGEGQSRSVANPRPVEPVPASPGVMGLTYAALFAVIGGGVAIPVASMASWVWEGVQRGLPFASPWLSVRDTLVAALVGALVTAALAALPAWTTGRDQRGASRWLVHATYLTSALPGVLLAFGLMRGSLGLFRLTPWSKTLYVTLLSSGVLLMLGYATRYLAEVYTPLRTAVMQIDPRQEDSATLLGATAAQRWRVVRWPTLSVGVRTALLLGFLAILKELPVTLLLGGATGLHTLAFRVWDRYAEALWHDAGLAGLLLVGLALLVAWPTLGGRRAAAS